MQIPTRNAKRAGSVKCRFALPRPTFESVLQVRWVRVLALDSTSPDLSSVGITERLKPRLNVTPQLAEIATPTFNGNMDEFTIFQLVWEFFTHDTGQ